MLSKASLFIEVPALFTLALLIDKHGSTSHFFFYGSTSTLEHVLIFLECDAHVLMNLVSFIKNSSLTNFETWQNRACFAN